MSYEVIFSKIVQLKIIKEKKQKKKKKRKIIFLLNIKNNISEERDTYTNIDRNIQSLNESKK